MESLGKNINFSPTIDPGEWTILIENAKNKSVDESLNRIVAETFIFVFVKSAQKH